MKPDCARKVPGTLGPLRCGHPHEAHEHDRPGNDCALCGCRIYRSPWPWRALRLAVGLAVVGTVALLIAVFTGLAVAHASAVLARPVPPFCQLHHHPVWRHHHWVCVKDRP